MSSRFRALCPISPLCGRSSCRQLRKHVHCGGLLQMKGSAIWAFVLITRSGKLGAPRLLMPGMSGRRTTHLNLSRASEAARLWRYWGRGSPRRWLGGVLAVMSLVSLLTLCGKWLTVEPGAAVEFLSGMAGFSINGFGFASGLGEGSGFLCVMALTSLLPLVFASVQAFRRPLARRVPLALLISGIMHLLTVAIFVVVAQVGNDDFTHEDYGRMAGITLAGGWYIGLIIGILLTISGVIYMRTRKKISW